MEETLNPFIRRILAPNPSPMTFLGTNTYLLGKKEVAVIDPRPISSSHLNTDCALIPRVARADCKKTR